MFVARHHREPNCLARGRLARADLGFTGSRVLHQRWHEAAQRGDLVAIIASDHRDAGLIAAIERVDQLLARPAP
jgi:hypothetical protein